MNKKLYEALNEQINHEFYAAHLYLQMAAQFDEMSLTGFSHWMREQFKEEEEHALKIYDYLLERGQKVELMQIEKPDIKWEKPIEAFEAAYEHEKHVTSLIHRIMDIAIEVKDYPTISLMNWYVDEQVEEEANTSYIVDQLKYAKDNDTAILAIDRQLSQRA